MASVQFSCTLCGKCCHNHSLPLTMLEAINWLEEGGVVGIYCEGIQDRGDLMDAKSAHRKLRGFPVTCGDSKLHVTAILAALLSGACQNLGEDMRCKIYERRPLVCRVYPAEISPFVQLDPANKVCPPEAWLPVGQPENGYAQLLPELATQSRLTDYQEAARKSLLCRELGIRTTALADEGYVRHIPEAQQFLDALKYSFSVGLGVAPTPSSWHLISASIATDLRESGLDVMAAPPPGAPFQFLPF